MGSDVYAYFTLSGEEAHSDQLDALAKDAGNDLHADGIPITARLDAGSHVKRGEKARLWYDTSKMQIFDAASGANLVPGDKD